jgi:hypothetical protein
LREHEWRVRQGLVQRRPANGTVVAVAIALLEMPFD